VSFDFAALIEQKDAILTGLLNTAWLSLSSAVLALVLGLVVAVGKKSSIPIVSWLLSAYIQFFRNTPLLIQIYFFYKGLPNLGIVLSPMMCGILALSLQTGAYLAEIFRSGIESIPREQFEGGLSLGFSRMQTYLTIILPQAMGVILPPVGNQMVGLVKNSSLVAFITVPDLFFMVFSGAAEHFQYLEFFTLGIALYMLLTLIVSGLFIFMERQISYVRRMQESEAQYA
jgi:aspartate/glutamate/glutamine transport system permease protein